MKSIKKSVISLSLASALTLGLGASAFAATDEAVTNSRAEALYELSLFQGSDIGFELERTMTRMEAIIMMVRLTGNEWTALYEENEHPFTDAPTWENADKYVGYAYQNGLITGVSDTLLDPNSLVDTQMYMTLVLRALEYEDGDSTIWNNWEALSADANIDIADVMDEDFTRGDMVYVSYDALESMMQGDEEITLAESLINKGTFGEFTYAIAKVTAGAAVTTDSELLDIAAAIYAGTSDVINTQSFGTIALDSENMAYFLGTTIDIEEGLAIEPMMSSTAHSVCLIRVSDDADVEQIKADILENVDPYKWICVGVDDENVRVENIGNLILLVMDNNASGIIGDNFQGLEQKKNNDLEGFTQIGDMYVEDFSTFSADNVEKHADKLTALQSEYFADNNVFYAIVPDKSYYASDYTSAVSAHDDISAIFAEELTSMTGIDLADSLTLADYYNTDPHWQQDKLSAVLGTLGESMGFEIDFSSFTATEYEDFAGSYQRKISDIQSESIMVLTSDAINKSVSENFQYPDNISVYNMQKLDSTNPYDIFLDGATPLVTITNPNAQSERTLILFRDSFGSSIAPLLLEEYSNITLIDLRYMASSLLPQYIDFSNADVLFLLSDALVNGNMLLK